MQTMPGSPVSDGGRGLKPKQLRSSHLGRSFARQRWRAWIETRTCGDTRCRTDRSPVSDGGRGLKPALRPLQTDGV